jgi:arylsulfatase A-like enzyme
MIFLPFPVISIAFLVYCSVSISVYSIAGIAAGAITGGIAILVSSHVHLPRGSPRRENRAPLMFISLLAWAILSAGGNYYIHRLLPDDIMSSRSLILSAAISGAAGLFVAVSCFSISRVMRSRAVGAALLRASRTFVGIIIVLSWVVAATAYVRERICTAPAALRPWDQRIVILISIDALRPDHLSCYGYSLPTSPAIDHLAGSGVLFTNAYCQSSTSTPSHATMLTGLYPAAHGAVKNGNLLCENVRTVSEMFRAGGYETGAFLTNPWINREFGFSQGYDIFVENGILQSAVHPEIGQFISNLWLLEAWDRIRGRDLSFGRAMQWIENHADERFFLFVHLLDPHSPYEPPRGYAAPFLPVNADKAGRTLAAYDGEIRLADEKVGSLVAEIKGLGLWENTILCLTSDHGESMGEHGGKYGHGSLYESDLRVPLLLVCPGVLPSGGRITFPVESADIVPTLLGLSGMGGGEVLDGRDLSSAARLSSRPPAGWEDSGPRDARIGADSPAPHPVFAQNPGEYAVRSGVWKLIWNAADSIVVLYDLSKDPLEQCDIAAGRQDVMEELFPVLAAWVAGGVQNGREPAGSTEGLHPLTRTRLRSLGYLE